MTFKKLGYMALLFGTVVMATPAFATSASGTGSVGVGVSVGGDSVGGSASGSAGASGTGGGSTGGSAVGGAAAELNAGGGSVSQRGDLDGSGSLSRQEYMSTINGTSSVDAIADFTRRDTNKDGLLDGSETR